MNQHQRILYRRQPVQRTTILRGRYEEQTSQLRTRDNTRSAVFSGPNQQSSVALEINALSQSLSEVNLGNTGGISVTEVGYRDGRLSVLRISIDMEAETTNSVQGQSEDSLSNPISNGLREDQIQMIPCKMITTEDVKSELACSICMEDFNVDEEVRELKCQHTFHSQCILSWLRQKNTCPVCRGVVDLQTST